jgi:LCP family protein required for cell wall assembly
VDTLAIAEREAKQEAAHAGLRARAEKAAAGRTTSTGAQASVAGAVAAVPAAGAGEPPKRNVGWRFFAAAFVVVASIAAATSIAFLLYLTDIGEDLRGDDRFAAAVERDLSDVEGGSPQTILILGSDQRASETGDPGRSDTTMLLRVDPDKEFLALLSLPRDLQVEIPGYGTDRLNAAYSYGEQFEADRGGGPQLTLRTVKQLLGIDINHIVNVDFEGFYDAINAIGCVYIDVDRHYYNPQGGEYDDIDIEAGYTKLCGYRALDYVRYRHNDNDLVRGARQQSFVREARQQIPPRSLLPPPLGDAELIDIFTKYTTSDINDAPTIVGMLRSFVDVRNAPVRQVSLGELSDNATGVSASGEDVKVAVDQFLGNDLDAPAEETPADEPEPEPEGDGKKKDKKDEPASGPAVIDVTGPAQEYAVRFQARLRRQKAGLPVFYPTAAISNPAAAISPESRMHVIEPPEGEKKPYWGYKFVIPFQEGFGLSYYGLAGTNWTDPPILKNPSETREIDGRDYLLYYEKDRLRLVGWTTNDGAYWVSNTLTRTLSEDEMLAVATSTREVED